MNTTTPIVYLWSTKERKAVIRRLGKSLKRRREFRTVPWWDCFPPGSFTWDAIENAIRAADFAVFYLAGEDKVRSRGRQSRVPRDNVILEVGLALGELTRERAFLLYCKRDKAKIPNDLDGVTHVPFRPGSLEEAARTVVARMRLLGPKERQDVLVPYADRSQFSTGFISTAISRVDTFGGDLTFLKEDLPTFCRLAKRPGTEVRFLTSEQSLPGIERAQRVGITFRQYGPGDAAPLKGTILDWNDERNCRAIIVRKENTRPHIWSGRSPFSYSMKAYSGPRDAEVIGALAALFNKYWAKGRPVRRTR